MESSPPLLTSPSFARHVRITVFEPTQAHYQSVVRGMLQGKVVPFLGVGVSMAGRPVDAPWRVGRYLPDSRELATHLAGTFDYPPGDLLDLLRVSQFIQIMAGSGPLYDELRQVFDADYPPNSLHALLARFPRLVRERVVKQYQLIVTTNYDDALERAFLAAGEEFDLVNYIADGEHRGRFRHFRPDGRCSVIERPNEYSDLSLDRRTIILKIHGAVDRQDSERDSYVITEDHYIDYLTRTDISNLVPVTAVAKIRRSHFLFLGYSLRDWNLRVILHRIWGGQALTYRSWAIQLDTHPVERESWGRRGVEILYASLDDYAEQLSAQLDAYLLPSGPGE